MCGRARRRARRVVPSRATKRRACEVVCLPTWARSWSCLCWHARCDRGRLQQASAPLFAQPVAVAADGDDVAVMEEVVEDRGRHHGIAERSSPLADRAIAGDRHAAALVTMRDELKEEMRRIGLERQIAELVDDQQFRFAEVSEAILEPTLAMGLGELRY
jgi:hypothetical protein